MNNYQTASRFLITALILLLSGTAGAVVSKGDYGNRKDTECIGCHINVTPDQGKVRFLCVTQRYFRDLPRKTGNVRLPPFPAF